MSERRERESVDFWDLLVRSPEAATPQSDDDRLILAIDRLFPDVSSDAARLRARQAISGWPSASYAPSRSDTHGPATIAAPGRSVIAARRSRTTWCLAAAAVLIVLVGAALWVSEGTNIWSRVRPNREHTIPAAMEQFGDVPMRGIDAGRTNAGPGPGIDRQPDVAWEYRVNGTIRTSPLIVGDVVYFGSSSDVPGETGRVLAVRSNDGSLIWSFATEQTLSTAFLVDAGTLYAVDDGGTIYALDARTGTQRWSIRLTDDAPFVFTYYGAPLLIDGRIVVSSGSPMSVAAGNGAVFVARPADPWIEGDSHVYAISPRDGQILWDTPGYADLDGGLFALSLDDGSFMWSRSGTPAYLGPAYANGTVYYGEHAPTRLIALDALTGREQWLSDIAPSDEWDGRGSPSLTTDLVVVGTNSGVIVGVDRESGDIRWTQEALPDDPMHQVQSSIPIDGEIAIAVAWPEIAAIDLADQTVLWSLPIDIEGWGVGPLTASNELILAAAINLSDDNDMLVALRPPPNAP